MESLKRKEPPRPSGKGESGKGLGRTYECSHDMPIPPVFGGAEASDSGRCANSDSDGNMEKPLKFPKVVAGKGTRRGKGFRLPRYTGILKRYNPQLGGFMISSPELRTLYEYDVVVHRDELPPNSYTGIKLSFVACEEESVRNPVAHQLEQVSEDS